MVKREKLVEGARVEAMEKGTYYPGSIIRCDDDRATVLFDDGSIGHRLPLSEICAGNTGEVCHVCGRGDAPDDENPIVICDKCGMHVHMHCYGVDRVPTEDEEWLCEPCRLDPNGPGSASVRCALCPVTGEPGAFSRVADRPGVFVHTACVLATPGIGFESAVDKRGLGAAHDPEHLACTDPERAELRCEFCGEGGGVPVGPNSDPSAYYAAVQCPYSETCYVAMHVLCARKRGMLVEDADEDDACGKTRVYCCKHSRARRLEMVAADQSEAACKNVLSMSAARPSERCSALGTMLAAVRGSSAHRCAWLKKPWSGLLALKAWLKEAGKQMRGGGSGDQVKLFKLAMELLEVLAPALTADILRETGIARQVRRVRDRHHDVAMRVRAGLLILQWQTIAMVSTGKLVPRSRHLPGDRVWVESAGRWYNAGILADAGDGTAGTSSSSSATGAIEGKGENAGEGEAGYHVQYLGSGCHEEKGVPAERVRRECPAGQAGGLKKSKRKTKRPLGEAQGQVQNKMKKASRADISKFIIAR